MLQGGRELIVDFPWQPRPTPLWSFPRGFFWLKLAEKTSADRNHRKAKSWRQSQLKKYDIRKKNRLHFPSMSFFSCFLCNSNNISPMSLWQWQLCVYFFKQGKPIQIKGYWSGIHMERNGKSHFRKKAKKLQLWEFFFFHWFSSTAFPLRSFPQRQWRNSRILFILIHSTLPCLLIQLPSIFCAFLMISLY